MNLQSVTHIVICFAVISAMGCTHPQKSGKNGNATTEDTARLMLNNSSESKAMAQPVGNSKPDTILFVGVFARWQKAQGEYFDGTYDTSRKIFKMCTNHQCKVVPQSQITFQTHGNCDTSPHELMTMMLMFRTDSIVSFPENVLSIQLDTLHRKAVGVYGTSNSTKNILLNDWDYNRIEATYSAADKTSPVQQKIMVVHSFNPTLNQMMIPKVHIDTVKH